MSQSGGWRNPIVVGPGKQQTDVDPSQLRPARGDLIRSRVEFQRSLIRGRRARLTPIQVSEQAVIIDGHHYVRAAAEEGILIEVVVSSLSALPKAGSVLDLPLR
jgi:hypothetical protein